LDHSANDQTSFADKANMNRLFFQMAVLSKRYVWNPEKIQVAKDNLTSAIVGFLFVVFSLVILQVIGYDILRIPGINP
jgi:hypothetical protein